MGVQLTVLFGHLRRRRKRTLKRTLRLSSVMLCGAMDLVVEGSLVGGLSDDGQGNLFVVFLHSISRVSYVLDAHRSRVHSYIDFP